MKKHKCGISIGLIIAIVILMIPFSVSASGEITSPNYGFDKRTLTLEEYNSVGPQTIELQLTDSIKGAEANLIVENANINNANPAADEEWILLKYHVKYVAGPPDEILRATDVIRSSSDFYTNTGVAIKPIGTANFPGDPYGLSEDNVLAMSVGQERDIWYGLLVKQTVGYPLYRVTTGYNIYGVNHNPTYTWFSSDPIQTTTPSPIQLPVPTVSYQTHVQDIGWQDYVSNGAISGTSAQSKRLEGIRIKLANVDGGIKYRTHVQSIGWMGWSSNDAINGTSGMQLRFEAIEICLTGGAAEQYDVYYQVHAQNYGWLDWAKNGESAGTKGYGYRLEAIQIVLVAKGGPAPGSVSRPFVDLYSVLPTVSYQTHVQELGWQSYVKNGAVSGTSAHSLRLEAIHIRLENMAGSIEYRTHVQDIGWMDWSADDAQSGTSGQSKRLEAIQIRLKGAAAEQYDIYYCVHAQNCGWLDWAKNGESAGTAAFGYRLEAIMIVLVPKGGSAPGSMARSFIQG